MTDSSNSGGLVKKLLFPASASGANDTFRSPLVEGSGNTTGFSSSIPFPTSSSPLHVPLQQSSHHTMNRQGPSLMRDGKQPTVAPPRFFSSTHPSSERQSFDHHESRKQTLQTPARVPSSPPLLNRQPVTPSSEMETKATTSNRNGAQRRLFSQSSSMSVSIDDVGQRERSSQAAEDNSLQFLNDFKSVKQREARSTTTGDVFDESTKTEVHANTTSKNYQRQQQQHEVLVAATKLHLEETTKPATHSLLDQHEEPAESSINNNEAATLSETPTAGPSSQRDIDNEENEGDDSSIRDLHSYPSYSSYYDNPYHNPLASALKPNDLFRKEGDTSMGSDINSNASEMGTVIGAPMSLMAERFAEVDEMEREGKLAMQLDDGGEADATLMEQQHHISDTDIFDEEVDPAMANYKAFRVDDDDDDATNASNNNGHEIDESLFSDPFRTPGSAPSAVSRIHNDQNERGTNEDSKSADADHGESTLAAQGETEFPPDVGHETPQTNLLRGDRTTSDNPIDTESSSPIRVPDLTEEALSVVDSEIGELIRQNAAENAGNGRVRSCSSNNSAEVFRTSSVGSFSGTKPEHSTPLQAQPPKHAEMNFRAIVDPSEDTERADDEVDAINDATSRDSFTAAAERRKKRPSSSLQRALTRAQEPQGDESESAHQQLDNGNYSEEKEAKEEELREEQQLQQYRFEVPVDDRDKQPSEVPTGVNASHVASIGLSPGRGLAGTLRRIGLDHKRPSPSSRSATQYMFDLEDDEEDNFDNQHHVHDDESFSAPSSPGRSEQQGPYVDDAVTSEIQEAIAQSPVRSRSPDIQTEAEKEDPASLLLRSPGTSARLMADFRRESSSSSGFTGIAEGHTGQSAWNGRVSSMLHSESSNSLGNGPTPRAKGSGANNDLKSAGANALRLARGFLSFDTTVDEEQKLTNEGAGANHNHRLESSLSFDSSRFHKFRANKPDQTGGFVQRSRQPEEKGPTGGRTQALYGSSRSWDISSGLASSTIRPSASSPRSDPITEIDEEPKLAGVTLDAGAFRVAPYVRMQPRVLHQQHPHAHGYNNASSRRLVSGERQERLRLMSESSVAKSQTTNLELLQTPQRIEIEREDALNLLSMLCERGVALHTDQTESQDAEPQEDEEAKQSIDDDQADDTPERPIVRLEAEDIDAAVHALREISNGSPQTSDSPDHKLRMQVLDELVRSHTYAHEMKRAALSASAWLRSIGHREDKEVANDPSDEEEPVLQAAGEGEEIASNSSAIEVQALKAMLHQAQMEAREKEETTLKLNAELSNCRAEIGRLKSSVSRSKTSFTSPNRSILDDEEESLASTAEAYEAANRNDFDNTIADQSMVDLNSSLFADQDGAEVVRENDTPETRELAMFKSALSDANAIIKKLHSELQDAKPDNEYRAKKPPVIDVSQKAFSVALVDESNDRSPGSVTDSFAEQKTVNVRMLDAENFVTDWDSLQSLPPPPDHGLRAPIVSALLQQWSPDEGLHQSLLSWMDRAMSGADPATIPPLTLSSLDHQVRDGFTMHVLPLLLRRSDILVDVRTRAHRKTTYDVAIDVKRNNARHLVQGVRYMESFAAHENNSSGHRGPEVASTANSVTHSAITAHIRNGNAPTQDLHEVGSNVASYAAVSHSYSTLLPHRPSDEQESSQQQSGLIGALGGALGGLWSRRKPPSKHYDAGIAASSSYDMGSAVGAAGLGTMDFPSPNRHPQEHVDSDEPYHRLVSAPPGRIGVSFVEYRGHAMVSDVAEDSPLLGWIFPSDILIAIDEKAVTGMRLKDIVKVLQGRSDRQRALRVISSRAMNEFTMGSPLGSPTFQP